MTDDGMLGWLGEAGWDEKQAFDLLCIWHMESSWNPTNVPADFPQSDIGRWYVGGCLP